MFDVEDVCVGLVERARAPKPGGWESMRVVVKKKKKNENQSHAKKSMWSHTPNEWHKHTHGMWSLENCDRPRCCFFEKHTHFLSTGAPLRWALNALEVHVFHSFIHSFIHSSPTPSFFGDGSAHHKSAKGCGGEMETNIECEAVHV